MAFICCRSCCKKSTDDKIAVTKLKPSEADVRVLLKTTTLKAGQINYLYKRFCLIGKHSTVYPPINLVKMYFLNLGRLGINPILSILLKQMFDKNRTLTFIQFAKFLATFQPNTLKTTKEELDEAANRKVHLLFRMWDCDNDGIISRKDLIHIVHKLYGDIMSTYKVLNIVDIMLDEMASGESDEILFKDFKESLAVFDMSEALVTKISES